MKCADIRGYQGGLILSQNYTGKLPIGTLGNDFSPEVVIEEVQL